MAHPKQNTNLSPLDIEISRGADDDDQGIHLGLEDEPFWRAEILVDGSIKSGNGFSPPTALPTSSDVDEAIAAQHVVDNGTYGVGPFGFPFTCDPRAGGGAAVWPAANRGVYARVQGAGPITAIGFEVGTASGNISVAVYRNTGAGRAGAPGTRLATSGAVACPASGFRTVALGVTVDVVEGDWFFLSCDNTTASFARQLAASGSALVAGMVAYEVGAHPAPTTPAGLSQTSYTPLLVGVA